METRHDIPYGLSQRPRSEYPAYVQQFLPTADECGDLDTAHDHEHAMHAALLYDAVLRYQAQTVLEIGTRDGKSSRIIVEALKQTGGHLYTVDKNPLSSMKEVPEADRHYVTRIFHDSQILEWIKPAEVVYIDSSHDYQETYRELEKFYPVVTTPGVLILTDSESHAMQKMAVQNWAEARSLGYVTDSRAQGVNLFYKPEYRNQYRDQQGVWRWHYVPSWMVKAYSS